MTVSNFQTNHIEIEWLSIFQITHGISKTFRKKNVFLVGDAGHIHSPVGGQGMNYGMQDAINLLWKLAWVKRASIKYKVLYDTSIETVLESYSHERHQLGQQ